MTLLPVANEPAAAEVEAEVDEDVEVRAPLAVITWAGGAMAAGLAVMAIVLILGPLLGPAVIVAVGVAIVRRYDRTRREVDEP